MRDPQKDREIIAKATPGPVEIIREDMKAEEERRGRLALEFENQLLRENMEQSTTLSPSQVCARFHFQNCHACDKADCGDNITPSIVTLKKQALREVKERTDGLERALEMAVIGGPCPYRYGWLRIRRCPRYVRDATDEECAKHAVQWYLEQAQEVKSDG